MIGLPYLFKALARPLFDIYKEWEEGERKEKEMAKVTNSQLGSVELVSRSAGMFACFMFVVLVSLLPFFFLKWQSQLVFLVRFFPLFCNLFNHSYILKHINRNQSRSNHRHFC
jgi:hypothetical protein